MNEVYIFDDRWFVEPQRFVYLMIGDIRWNLGQAELTKACHAAVWYQQRRRIGVCIRFKLWFWFLIYARINQRDCSWLPRNKKHPLCKFECCFTSTETVHLDFTQLLSSDCVSFAVASWFTALSDPTHVTRRPTLTAAGRKTRKTTRYPTGKLWLQFCSVLCSLSL